MPKSCALCILEQAPAHCDPVLNKQLVKVDPATSNPGTILQNIWRYLKPT